MDRGKLIVIVAPSGTGKSTLIKKLMQDIPELSWSVSCTTRTPRSGEREGVDYFFLKEEEFLTHIDKGNFLEWAKVHSNYYGTLKSYVEEALSSGKNLLFDLDVQGCDQVKALYAQEVQVIFIRPPSVEELKVRLFKRATDKKEVIEERLNNALSELKRQRDYDYLVTNDDFSKAYSELKKIILKILGAPESVS